MASPGLPTNLPTGLTGLPTSLPTGLPPDTDLGAAFRSCEEVSALCPVEATVLGYAPNLGASIFFTIGFALMGAATIWIGVRARTWTFMAALGMGCILEMAGPFLGLPPFHQGSHPPSWDDRRPLRQPTSERPS